MRVSAVRATRRLTTLVVTTSTPSAHPCVLPIDPFNMRRFVLPRHTTTPLSEMWLDGGATKEVTLNDAAFFSSS